MTDETGVTFTQPVRDQAMGITQIVQPRTEPAHEGPITLVGEGAASVVQSAAVTTHANHESIIAELKAKLKALAEKVVAEFEAVPAEIQKHFEASKAEAEQHL